MYCSYEEMGKGRLEVVIPVLFPSWFLPLSQRISTQVFRQFKTQIQDLSHLTKYPILYSSLGSKTMHSYSVVCLWENSQRKSQQIHEHETWVNWSRKFQSHGYLECDLEKGHVDRASTFISLLSFSFCMKKEK